MTGSHIATFDLTWPPRALGANFKGHWSVKGRAVKAQRRDSHLLAVLNTTIDARAAIVKAGRLAVNLEFIPPDRRLRDAQNMLQTCKGAIDGIQDAVGLDDRHFVVTHSLATEPAKPGAVRVRLALITAESPKEGG